MQGRLFEDPLVQPVPAPEIHRSAKISDCQSYRFELRRWWRAGPPVCWIMLNPSTADHRKDDPTIKRIIGFTQRWGYGGLIVVNLYPYRSPSPRDCMEWAGAFLGDDQPFDPYVRDACHENTNYVTNAAAEADLIITAWGAGNQFPMWEDNVLESICEDADIDYSQFMCLGKTKGGDPKHPLARGLHRIPDDAMPQRLKLGG